MDLNKQNIDITLETLEQLPTLLRETRQRLRMTQKTLASQLGVSLTTINYVENHKVVSLSLAVRILKWLQKQARYDLILNEFSEDLRN